jgi:hypothetical protein
VNTLERWAADWVAVDEHSDIRAPSVGDGGGQGHRVWWQKGWLGLRAVVELTGSIWRRREEVSEKMIRWFHMSDA